MPLNRRAFAGATTMCLMLQLLIATALLLDGTWYEPLALTEADSHSTYAAAPGARPVLSGGQELDLTWRPLGTGPVLVAGRSSRRSPRAKGRSLRAEVLRKAAKSTGARRGELGAASSCTRAASSSCTQATQSIGTRRSLGL